MAGLQLNVFLAMTFKIKTFHLLVLFLSDTDLVVVGYSTSLSGRLLFLCFYRIFMSLFEPD